MTAGQKPACGGKNLFMKQNALWFAIVLLLAGEIFLFLQNQSLRRQLSGPAPVAAAKAPASSPSPASLPPPDSAEAIAAQNYCQANLLQLDGAVEQWAFENHKPDGTPVAFSDLIGPDKFMLKMPVCGMRGHYSVSTVGVIPECSYHGHYKSVRSL